MALPYVSSEGGPLLLADYDALRDWRGAFHDSGDYEKACLALGEAVIAQLVGDSDRVLVWDIGGPGTAFLVQISADRFSLVRIWPDASWMEEDIEQAVISAASDHRHESRTAGILDIGSGYLLALWAPEDMTSSGIPTGDFGIPEDLSIGDGGIYLRVPRGRYKVTHHEWQTGTYDVTKLDLHLLP